MSTFSPVFRIPPFHIDVIEENSINFHRINSDSTIGNKKHDYINEGEFFSEIFNLKMDSALDQPFCDDVDEINDENENDHKKKSQTQIPCKFSFPDSQRSNASSDFIEMSLLKGISENCQLNINSNHHM